MYNFTSEKLIAYNSEHLNYLSALLTENFKYELDNYRGHTSNIYNELLNSTYSYQDYGTNDFPVLSHPKGTKEESLSFLNTFEELANNALARVENGAKKSVSNLIKEIQTAGKDSGHNFYIAFNSNEDGLVRTTHGLRGGYQITLGTLKAYYGLVEGFGEGALAPEIEAASNAIADLTSEAFEKLSEEDQLIVLEKIQNAQNFIDSNPEIKASSETAMIFLNTKLGSFNISKRIHIIKYAKNLKAIKSLEQIIPLKTRIGKRNGDNLKNVHIDGNDLLTNGTTKKDLDYVARGKDALDGNIDSKGNPILKGSVTETIMNNYFKRLYPPSKGYIFNDGKVDGTKGFDGIIYKKDSSGQISELIIMDGKQYKNGTVSVNKAKPPNLAQQLSNKWIRDKGAEMNDALGDDIISFMKKEPLERLEKYIGGITRNNEFPKKIVPEMVIFKLSNQY